MANDDYILYNSERVKELAGLDKLTGHRPDGMSENDAENLASNFLTRDGEFKPANGDPYDVFKDVADLKEGYGRHSAEVAHMSSKQFLLALAARDDKRDFESLKQDISSKLHEFHNAEKDVWQERWAAREGVRRKTS